MPGTDRRLTFFLGLVLLLAFLLRVEGLGAQSYWYDEGFSVDLATQSWREIVLGELNLPPLYNLLLGAWVRLVGTGEFSVRYLSAFWGVLIVALGGAMGALLLGRRAGALAALFLAASPIEVWYAQEARMYAMLSALTLASTVCLLRLMKGRGGRRLWGLYTLANIAAAYTHYYAALVLAAQAAWVLAHGLKERNARLLRPWTLSMTGLGLALMPWLPVFWTQFGAANTTYWPGQLSLRFIVEQTVLGVAGASMTVSPAVAQRGAILLCGLAALGALLALADRRLRWGALLLALYLIVPLAIFYGIVHNRPKFSPRYLLPVVPALLCLAGNGIAGAWPSRPRHWRQVAQMGLAVGLGSALAVTSVYAATNALRDSRFGRDDLRNAAEYLTYAAKPDEAVILLSGHYEPAFRLYYRGGNCYPVPREYVPSPSTQDVITYDVLEELNEIIEGRQGVWLLLWQDNVVDPNGVVLTAFDIWTSQLPVGISFRGLELRHYIFPKGTRLRRETAGYRPLNAIVGQQELSLIGCDLPAEAVPSGGVATFIFSWQALRPVSQDYHISLRIVDDQGQELARQDGRLSSHMNPTDQWRPGVLMMGRHDVRLPLGLPPGEYGAEAHIYPWRGQVSQVVALGRFRVGRALRQPTPAEMGIPQPFYVAFGELDLLGYQVSPREAAPGQTVYLTFVWQAHAHPAQLYRVALSLGDRPWAPLALPASLTEMQAGDVFRVQYPLTISRDMPEGQHWLLVTLEGMDGRPVAPPFAVTQLKVQVGQRLFVVPADIRNPQRVNLGDKVTFLGSDLVSGSIRPGETLHLTLYWQAVQPMDTSYTVFTHVLDAKEKIWGQVDRLPVHNTRPTNGWLPGEVLIDVYEIPVAADAPPGQYVIEVGMYDAATGTRLVARDETGRRLHADRILLEPVMLRPPQPPPARP